MRRCAPSPTASSWRSLTAAVSAAIAVPLAYLATLRKNPAARVLDVVADAPYAVPGTVLAIAIILVFLPPLPFLGVSLYGTLGIILVAYLARFLALALRPTVAGMELRQQEPRRGGAGRRRRRASRGCARSSCRWSRRRRRPARC